MTAPKTKLKAKIVKKWVAGVATTRHGGHVCLTYEVDVIDRPKSFVLASPRGLIDSFGSFTGYKTTFRKDALDPDLYDTEREAVAALAARQQLTLDARDNQAAIALQELLAACRTLDKIK